MQLIRYHPAPPLPRYIECFWWSHRDESQRHSEHMLPSGGAQMVFAVSRHCTLISRGNSRGAATFGAAIFVVRAV